MLLPRELDIVAAGKQMPLPLKKPAIGEDKGRKDEVKKQDAKSKRQAGKSEEEAKTPRRKTRQQSGRSRWGS